MPGPKTRELPNPIEETINWCRLNRPDCVEHLERIHKKEEERPSESTQALLLLISLGFAAGRVFQAAPAHDEVPLFGKSPYDVCTKCGARKTVGPSDALCCCDGL